VCIISFCIITVIHLLTRRVSLVKQELLSLPEHLSSPPVFSGVRVTRSLVLYVCFVDRCLFFCTFSFGHCVVCSSSIYGFWLPLWYLQTLLNIMGEGRVVSMQSVSITTDVVSSSVNIMEAILLISMTVKCIPLPCDNSISPRKHNCP
jgi:hypothetical protein